TGGGPIAARASSLMPDVMNDLIRPSSPTTDKAPYCAPTRLRAWSTTFFKTASSESDEATSSPALCSASSSRFCRLTCSCMRPMARTMTMPKSAKAITTTPSSSSRVQRSTLPTVLNRIASKTATIASGAATASHRNRLKSISSLALATSDCAPGGSARYKPKSTAAASRIGHLQNEVEFDGERIIGVNQSEQRSRCGDPEVTHSQRKPASQPEAASAQALRDHRKLDVARSAGEREPAPDYGAVEMLVEVMLDRARHYSELKLNERVSIGPHRVAHVAFHRPAAGAAKRFHRHAQVELRSWKAARRRLAHPDRHVSILD